MCRPHWSRDLLTCGANDFAFSLTLLHVPSPLLKTQEVQAESRICIAGPALLLPLMAHRLLQVFVAGATGRLGARIVKMLLEKSPQIKVRLLCLNALPAVQQMPG